MKRGIVFAVGLFAGIALIAGIALAQSQGKQTGKAEGKAGNILYVCDCGPKCTCNTVATKPGKCTCGEALAAMHILKIEGTEALLCTCGKGCQCKLDPKDPTKCGCGKDVKRVSLKGLYACGCAAGCTCNAVSDKPGKCGCNAPLKKVM